MRIGIIRETKTPPDRRVPFSPDQLAGLKKKYPDHDFVVESSPIRCFSDREYTDAGIEVRYTESGAERTPGKRKGIRSAPAEGKRTAGREAGTRVKEAEGAGGTMGDCDILFGVKEVESQALIPGKTYCFFSHTGKQQPYNRALLKEIATRGNSLVDYEYLADSDGIRLVAFGRWAGIVGAYNGLRAYGERYRQYSLKPAHECHDLDEMKEQLAGVKNDLYDIPPLKILVTGGGRVAFGAMETLGELGLETVPPGNFLADEFDRTVVCRIDPWDYVRRMDGERFELAHFFRHPEMYESIFKPYTKVTDLFIACHYWDPRSPVFMTPSDMREPDFHIRVIADVSCDLLDPIPSTLRASTIDQPFYGYDPLTESETAPFDLQSLTVMAVDNLPGELPRDASVDFGSMLMERILPALLGKDPESIIKRATIVKAGELTEYFSYLKDYLAGG